MRKRNVVSFIVGLYLITAALLCVFGVGFNRVITVFSQYNEERLRTCIVIDPGHGGEDGGAVSCTGITESTLNLQFSLRLQPLLELLGFKTAMIRITDTAVYTTGGTIAAKKASDLRNRVKIVSETPNALLVSIHQNTFPDKSCSGAQVFYAAGAGSETLANSIQEELIRSVNPGGHRMAKKADSVYLMEHISCTGVLVECGFLSNPGEEASLRQPDYQKKLCCVIAAAVSDYCANSH